jgi:tetratricopeptide (TPR) repeat protein
MKSVDASSTPRRIAAAAFWIAICLVGIWFTSRVGYGRLLSKYASLTGSVAAATRAVEFSPLDAQVHSSRAAVFYNGGLTTDAANEFELAVSLRPKDDYLWLQLGVLRDELGHPGALLAFNESVRRAPYYGHPKWQRGNYLLRTGHYEEGFADLRTAATSNQTLIPSLIDLAWGVSRQNAELTKQWAGITDDQMRVAFARFLATHGQGREAIEQFRASRVVSLQARRQLMADLITSNAFREAFEIWRGMDRSHVDLTAIHGGDFESGTTSDESGFGWRFAQSSPGARMSLDPNKRQSGKHSLLVTFLGYSDPNTVLLSQLLLVEPHKSYRVKFSVLTENLVTGGLPLVTIYDAADKKKRLGQSATIGIESNSWQSLSFDFKTNDQTQAVELGLQRQPCKDGPCPIFGSLWLDNFAIEELR